MSDLLRLALTLLAPAVAVPVQRSLGRTAMAIAAIVLAALLGIAALGCAAAALWIWAETRVGSVGAPLVVTGSLLALAAATAAAAMHVARPAALAPMPPVPAIASTEPLFDEATRLIRAHKAPILLAALLMGLVMGRSEK